VLPVALPAGFNPHPALLPGDAALR
jgi:hypothetical protein